MGGTRVEVGSSNLDLLEILRRGHEVWNQWREKNPQIEIDLSGSDLISADLTEANLTEANLTEANLTEANLHSANLRSANLRSANLRSANLTEANLSSANLNGAILFSAYLSSANLSSAILISADLRRAKLNGANLNGANLRSANLRSAILIWADLSSADLSSADLSSANLRDADLSDANLSFANLSFAKLRDTIISDETKIDPKWKLVHELINKGGKGKDLSFANLSFANLSFANLRAANLRWANLNGADLSSAILISADLRRAKLNGAILRSANLRSANLRSAILIWADLIWADLSSADLSSANLRDADLSDANLSFANLRFAKLRWANLNGANLSNVRLGIFNQISFNFQKFFNRSARLQSQDFQYFKIRIFDSTIDSDDLKQLQSALDEFALVTGYEEIKVTRQEFGSFFKDIRYKIARFISDDIQREAIEAGQEAYRGAKANVQQRLEKPGVESTKQIADATAALIAQVDKYDNAVVQAGKIIILKVTDERGQSRLYTRTVSSELQLLLERSPQLIDNPQDLLRVLNEQPQQLKVIEDDKAWPPQTEAV